MRPLDFFGSDGEPYRLGHVAEPSVGSGHWQPVAAVEAVHVVRSALADDRVGERLRWSLREHAPAGFALESWLTHELSRPAGVLALWRGPRRPARMMAGQTLDPGALLSDLAGAEPAQEHTWVAFRLLDLHGDPIPDMRYELTLADGSVEEGATDASGEARHDGIVRGGCVLVFPDLPERYWENVHNAE